MPKRLGQHASHLESGTDFRKIIGHEDLWMLKAVPTEGRPLREESDIPFDNGRLAG